MHAETQVVELRQSAIAALTSAAAQHASGPGAYRAISDALNNRSVRSPTSQLWTSENVRKYMKRHDIAFARNPMQSVPAVECQFGDIATPVNQSSKSSIG